MSTPLLATPALNLYVGPVNPQCDPFWVPSYSIHLKSQFCSFQSPQRPLMMHTINVTTSRMPPLAGTTSPCNEAGEPKNRFQTFRLGHYAVRTEQSSRNSGRAAARSRKKGKTQVRERKRRAKDMRSKKKKRGTGTRKKRKPRWGKGRQKPRQMPPASFRDCAQVRVSQSSAKPLRF